MTLVNNMNDQSNMNDPSNMNDRQNLIFVFYFMIETPFFAQV